MMLQSDSSVKEKNQAKRSNHFLETVNYKMNYCTKIVKFTQNTLSSKGHGFSISFFISNANLLESTETILPSELWPFSLSKGNCFKRNFLFLIISVVQVFKEISYYP